MPRIGRSVQQSGAVGSEKLAEVAADLRRMAAMARDHGATVLLLGATEAVRRAADRDTVLAAASAAAEAPCRLISAPAEARLSFRGAAGAHPGSGPTLVADVGGASTECALGEGDRVDALASIPVGSGMATETWLHDDPPTAAQLAECAAGVRAALEAAPAGHPTRGIATGGTATTLPQLLGRGRDHLGELDTADLERCRDRLAALPSKEIAAIHGIDPARARVLAGGGEIIGAVSARYALDRLTVSLAGLRDGMILAWLDKGDAWPNA